MVREERPRDRRKYILYFFCHSHDGFLKSNFTISKLRTQSIIVLKHCYNQEQCFFFQRDIIYRPTVEDWREQMDEWVNKKTFKDTNDFNDK